MVQLSNSHNVSTYQNINIKKMKNYNKSLFFCSFGEINRGITKLDESYKFLFGTKF